MVWGKGENRGKLGNSTYQENDLITVGLISVNSDSSEVTLYHGWVGERLNTFLTVL